VKLTKPAIAAPPAKIQRPCVWEATDRQSLFLECDDYEVLYGGAVGGGKSDALLIDGWCLPFMGHRNPNHRAIIFRRSYPELEELIDRAADLWPQFIGRGLKYDKVSHRFTTPHGAKFQFGYMQNDKDRFKYKRAWNWIGFDELTLWASSVGYEYLMTRNRSTDKSLPKYMRATTNPDGPGQKWVMERWGITPEGDGTRIAVPVQMEVEDGRGGWMKQEREITRTFIPARLSDNPHLRGTGYREILQMQDDPDVVEALLEGKWIGNRVRGAVYVNQMQKARNEGRICAVSFNPAFPVNTFWDLGYNDTTAIWFHQQVGPANHFLRCFENSGVGLEYYASELQRLSAEFGYTYKTHYLPHDGAHRSRKAQGKNDKELLEALLPGQRFEVGKVTPSKITGINQTRAGMATAYFDKVNCADGIAALDAYHFRFDQNLGSYSTEPVHDWSSNYADALRGFGQDYEPIRQITEQATPEWKRNLLSRTKRRNAATA